MSYFNYLKNLVLFKKGCHIYWCSRRLHFLDCRIRDIIPMKNLWDMYTSSSMTHGKRSPKAHHWSERIVRQIETRRMMGRDGRCYACNGWEQCRNVLQSFGECHNVTWPICVPPKIREESRTLAWFPFATKRSSVDCCNNAIEQMHRS